MTFTRAFRAGRGKVARPLRTVIMNSVQLATLWIP